MRNNLVNINYDIIFLDCTYKIILPRLKRYKFLVILSFDESKNKFILYLYYLINPE